MSIEDVDYLIRHSTQDSMMLFVDSDKRDRQHYATPSFYAVRMEEPVKYVFGVDILDAAIPTTMYNVDYNNNELRLVWSDLSIGSLTTVDTARVELETLSSHEVFEWAVRSEIQTHEFVTCVSSSSNSAVRTWLDLNKLPLREIAPEYCIFVRHSFDGVPLVPSQEPVDNRRIFDISGTASTVTADVIELVDPDGASPNRALVQWLSSRAKNFSGFRVIVSSLTSAQSLFSGTDNVSGSLFDIVYYECVPVSRASFTEFTTSVINRNDGSLRLALKVMLCTIEPGNYTINTFQSSIQELLQPFGIDATTSSASGAIVEKQNKLLFTSNENIMFAFCVNFDTSLERFVSSASGLLGFDDASTDGVNDAVYLGNTGLPSRICTRMLDSISGAYKNMLLPRGIVNLAGPRFITLRCPEIEEHICSTGKYSKYSTGLGVFKLASGNALAHLRFDFVSLVRKPFHPIGRISRLTLRFELPDGSLYDFKGINHQILMTLKYYVPSDDSKRTTTNNASVAVQSTLHPPIRSELNPDYDPDFLRFMIRNADEYHDDSEEEEDEDDYDEDDDEEDDDEEMKKRIIMQHYLNDFLSPPTAGS